MPPRKDALAPKGKDQAPNLVCQAKPEHHDEAEHTRIRFGGLKGMVLHDTPVFVHGAFWSGPLPR